MIRKPLREVYICTYRELEKPPTQKEEKREPERKIGKGCQQIMRSICQQTGKTQQWPQHWKKSVFIPIPKKGNAKECSNYHTVTLLSHASKVILKILQARLQQFLNQELPHVHSGFRKCRGTRGQITNVCWIIGKAKEF